MIVKQGISAKNVKKLPKHKYIDDSPDINREIYFKTIILLRAAKIYANENEAILLLRLGDFKYEMSSDNSDTRVTLNESMLHEINTNEHGRYIVIHNHPYGGTFSLGDLFQLSVYDKIVCVLAISNDCKHSYFMAKTSKFGKTLVSKVLIKILQYNIKHNKVSINGDAKKIIDRLAANNAIIYKEYNNY